MIDDTAGRNRHRKKAKALRDAALQLRRPVAQRSKGTRGATYECNKEPRFQLAHPRDVPADFVYPACHLEAESYWNRVLTMRATGHHHFAAPFSETGHSGHDASE